MFDRLLERFRRNERFSKQHHLALQYWKTCSDTFLASPEYYDKCQDQLQNRILPRLERVDCLLDAGCGNGRFTLVLAKSGRQVDAYDVSPALIKLAREAAEAAGVTNVRFRLRDITRLRPKKASYGIAVCMGVLSTIIDDAVFRKVVCNLTNAVSPGGFLLLRETLSSLPDGELTESDSYAIRYRNELYYRRTLAETGMNLEDEIPLIDAGTLANRMYLYRAANSPGLQESRS